MHGGGRSFAASGGKVRTCERPRGSPGAALFTVSRKDKVRKAGWRSHRGLSWPLLRLLGGQWGGEAVGSREAVALAVSPALSASLCCSFSLSLPLALSLSRVSLSLLLPSILFSRLSHFLLSLLVFLLFSFLSLCASRPSSNLSSFCLAFLLPSLLSHSSPVFVPPSSFPDLSFALYLYLSHSHIPIDTSLMFAQLNDTINHKTDCLGVIMVIVRL